MLPSKVAKIATTAGAHKKCIARHELVPNQNALRTFRMARCVEKSHFQISNPEFKTFFCFHEIFFDLFQVFRLILMDINLHPGLLDESLHAVGVVKMRMREDPRDDLHTVFLGFLQDRVQAADTIGAIVKPQTDEMRHDATASATCPISAPNNSSTRSRVMPPKYMASGGPVCTAQDSAQNSS